MQASWQRTAELSHSTEEEARETRREAVSGVNAPKNVGRATHAALLSAAWSWSLLSACGLMHEPPTFS
ncbi:plasmid stabilization protein [Methylosinus trichosporium OB3b]|uniref:Plasmid stabilization protein n=1 Tax=Methylosinus trichosporium (strain ATCC 35070 / NCIMB 11131 / UNIQEM 75 / OB3b) TaxID=595536 RepID=A0A2D2D1Z3_METT3|nr:plasmid stabilization protein [Methylosinus trichosporium OB3b]